MTTASDSGGVGVPRAAQPARGAAPLHELMERLPPELAKAAFTHSSWTTRRSDSYERLAFLGDSVLGLAVTTHLFPRLEAERYGPGRLTKIRAQAVSGRSCRVVAEQLVARRAALFVRAGQRPAAAPLAPQRGRRRPDGLQT